MFIKKIFLSSFISALVIFTPALAFAKTSTFSVLVNTGTLFVRSGPSQSYKKISQYTKGTKLTVYEQKNGWYRVGSGKWVSSTYVKKTTAVTAAKSQVKIASTKAPAPTTAAPSNNCMAKIASANAYCKAIAKGCISTSKTAKCVSANAQCEVKQKEALESCPQ